MDKDIKEVLGLISKKYGKTAVFKMSEKKLVNVDSISTQSLSLDAALGVGGMPRGRISEIYGPESAGKCVTKDSYISNPKGLLTLEEIFNDNNFTPSCINKIKYKKIVLQNKEGKEEHTNALTCNGRKKVYKLITKSGYTLNGSENQPVFVMNKHGYLQWKRYGDIEKNSDCVCIQRELFGGDINYDCDEMYMLGLIIADGSITERPGLSITNDDPDVKKFIETKIPKIIGIEPKKYDSNGKGSYDYSFNGLVKLDVFRKKYGYDLMHAKDKHVSKYVRKGNKESISWFLAGYFDSESYASSDTRSIEVSSASYKLLYQIKLLLQYYGIISTLSAKSPVKGYEDKSYWCLMLYSYNVVKFIENIPTLSTKVRKRYDDIIKKSNNMILNQNQDHIPNVNKLLMKMKDVGNRETSNLMYDLNKVELTYNKLGILLDNEYLKHSNSIFYKYLKYLYKMNYYFDVITDIKYIDELPTFDFSMKKSSSFIANGIVTHNSTLALHIIAEAQKIGRVCYIDTEHAMDPVYSKVIGVNIDDLYISQPDYAEQALEICDMLTSSGKFILIVLDSVAALVPKAELDGEMGAQQMGLQARLMSKALRKLTGISSKTNTGLIFINQIREKIGIVYGNPETTPGGRALKFYCSVRLDIRKRKQIKDDSGISAIECEVKVVKNKVAPPFKSGKLRIVFGKGIDKCYDVFSMGLKTKVIKKSGSIYTIPDIINKKFRGEKTIIDFFNRHPKAIKVVRKKILENIYGASEDKEDKSAK